MLSFCRRRQTPRIIKYDSVRFSTMEAYEDNNSNIHHPPAGNAQTGKEACQGGEPDDECSVARSLAGCPASTRKALEADSTGGIKKGRIGDDTAERNKMRWWRDERPDVGIRL